MGEESERIPGLYKNIMGDARYFQEDSILYLLKQNSEKLHGSLHIKTYTGTADILFAENEILHLYLDSLDIPHEYKVFEGVDHSLNQILSAQKGK